MTEEKEIKQAKKKELEKQAEQIDNLTIKLTRFFIKEKYTPEESLLAISIFLHEGLDICPNKEVIRRIKRLLKTIIEWHESNTIIYTTSMAKKLSTDISNAPLQHSTEESDKQAQWIARLEFLFKHSRQEVGVLKAYIDELEYERKQYLRLTIAELTQYKKDTLCRKLNKEIPMLRQENNTSFLFAC